jgi:predicted nucleic acid-binding protein
MLNYGVVAAKAGLGVLYALGTTELDMRVYLDNCCFNRPFDDQRQTRVRLEAEAKLYIQERIREGVLELCWSYVLDFENEANPYDERRRMIAAWRRYAAVDVDETESVVQQARGLTRLGLKAKDALHVACAISGECDYLITTDDVILRRAKKLERLEVLDPPSLIREMDV